MSHNLKKALKLEENNVYDDSAHLNLGIFNCPKVRTNVFPIHLFPRITGNTLWTLNLLIQPSRERLYKNMAEPFLAKKDIPAHGDRIAHPAVQTSLNANFL